MEELKTYLLSERKEQIAENMVRRLTSYAIGRELTVRDRFAVENILKNLAKKEYPLKDMIKEICLNPVFLKPTPK